MSEQCSTSIDDSRIKLSDPRSTSAMFKNEGRARHTKTKIDGCVVKDTTAADWLLKKDSVGAVIVELKGSDVAHALNQIRATVKIVKEHNLVRRGDRFGALVVCNCTPKPVLTKIQIAKDELGKQKIKLTVTSSTNEFQIEDLLHQKEI